jgi:hypothetical protein
MFSVCGESSVVSFIHRLNSVASILRAGCFPALACVVFESGLQFQDDFRVQV